MASTGFATKREAAFQSILDEYKKTGPGWELKFCDSFLSFMRRNTDVLDSQKGVKKITALASRQHELTKKQNASKSDSSSSSSTSPSSSSSSSSSSPSPSMNSTPSKPIRSSKEETTIEEVEDEEEEQNESATVEDNDPESKCPDPVNNGGITDKYTWTQTLKELYVNIDLPLNTRAKEIQVSIGDRSLEVKILQAGTWTTYAKGDLHRLVYKDTSTWTLDSEKSKKVLQVYLDKKNKMEWWPRILEGDPMINTKKIQPENSRLDDLDQDTQRTVTKMMFDQQQRQMGLPTSDEQQKKAILEKFMAQHPEMDFTNAKIG